MAERPYIKIAGLITVAEAAALRGTTREAVLDLVRRGRLRSERLLGLLLVHREEVEGLEPQKPGRKSKAYAGTPRQHDLTTS